MLRTPLALLLLCAASTAPALASAEQSPPGPPIPGLCLFARDAALGNSKAGQAANQRLQQLGAQIEAELNPEKQAIITENTALQNGAALPAAQRQTRIAALQQRAQTFSQLQTLRGAQLQQTRVLATQTIVAKIDPILAPLVVARRCSLVLERTATYGFNPAMDLTPAVVDQLNQQLPTVTFYLATPESVRR